MGIRTLRRAPSQSCIAELDERPCAGIHDDLLNSEQGAGAFPKIEFQYKARARCRASKWGIR